MSILTKWRRRVLSEPTDKIYFKISVRVVIEKDEDKFLATAPALPGLIIDGDTIEEIKSRVENGIFVHLVALSQNGDSLPVGPDLTIELHERSNLGFCRFGSPEPYSNPNDWTTLLWPTPGLLRAN